MNGPDLMPVVVSTTARVHLARPDWSARCMTSPRRWLRLTITAESVANVRVCATCIAAAERDAR